MKVVRCTTIIPLAIILALFLVPVFSMAYDSEGELGLVPCKTAAECNFGALMKLVDNVIKFVLYKLVLPIAAIMFAYAGFLMVTSGGSTESWSKAKSIFLNTVLGLIFALAAFIIIKLILTILGWDGSWIGF